MNISFVTVEINKPRHYTIELYASPAKLAWRCYLLASYLVSIS